MNTANVSNKDMSQNKFRPDIEGLRAIAILLVVGYHAKVPGLSGGYVGVDIFFVLSGYLITMLLVQEVEKTGTVNLARFYARRARRLLPALALVLLVTVLFSVMIFAPLEHRVVANAAISTAAYLSNMYFVVASTSYLGGSAEANPLLHTWSLSVEEQFYMVWPIFVMLSLGALRWQRGGISRRRLLSWMILVAIISFSSSWYLTTIRQPWAFFLCSARAWEFAIGAIAVLAPQGWALDVFSGKLNAIKMFPSVGRFVERNASLLGWIGLFGVVISSVSFNRTTIFPGLAALLPALSTVLVLRVGNLTNSSVSKVLCIRPFQEIGRLSYSWYLWHWPVLVFVEAIIPGVSLPTRIGLLIVSLVIAEASYRLVENPVRHHTFFAKNSINSLALAAVITLVCVGLSFGWRQASGEWKESPEQMRFASAKNDLSLMQTSGCNSNYYNIELNIDKCTAGAMDATRKMVLFGDSHALQWSPALEEIAVQNDLQLIVMTKDACAPVNIPYIYSLLGREYKECETWRDKVLEKIEEFNPELVVVSNSYFYPFSRTEWLNGSDYVIKAISNSSQFVVIMRDTPRFSLDPPSYLARKSWSPLNISQLYLKYGVDFVNPPINVYEIQRNIAKYYDNVSTVDMNDNICLEPSCDLDRDGTIIYMDTNHLSAKFSKNLAPLVAEKLKNIMLGNDINVVKHSNMAIRIHEQ
ncbi:MAG TPA: acyltransferase family protein [Geothermobacteraceae bacterium]|nr:acyltransferase family protein [Geothermobacteraceae bacterium]